MRAVEFLYMNTDSTDPFFEDNMKTAICGHCQQNETCDKINLPVISHMSRYIQQFMNEIAQGFALYPCAGSWQDQPAWFINQLNIARSARAKAEAREIKRQQQIADARAKARK